MILAGKSLPPPAGAVTMRMGFVGQVWACAAPAAAVNASNSACATRSPRLAARDDGGTVVSSSPRSAARDDDDTLAPRSRRRGSTDVSLSPSENDGERVRVMG